MPELNITVTDQIGIGFGGIHAPEMTQAEAEAQAAEVARFRKMIDWRSPAVCIDGRTLADGETPLPLGPHMAGGAETVLVAAKTVGIELAPDEILADLHKKDFVLGAHDADTNKAANYESGTGCGACDKCEANCGLFKEHKDAVTGTIEALMGEDFDAEIYKATLLSPVMVDMRALVGDDLTETLRNDGEGVSGHYEQFVIFNYQENTTIDRDAYFAATGKQVFVVDMWYLKKVANAVGSDDQQRSELYHAMVAFQVATYLGLCDGSHRAVVMN